MSIKKSKVTDFREGEGGGDWNPTFLNFGICGNIDSYFSAKSEFWVDDIFILVEFIALDILPCSAIKYEYITVYFIALLQCNKVNFNYFIALHWTNNCRKFNEIIYVIDLVILHAINIFFGISTLLKFIEIK